VDVENFPGALGTTGPTLVGLMRSQAAGFNATVIADAAISIDATTHPLTVTLNASSATPIHSLALIVALGAQSKWLGVQGEHAHRGGGVSSCATCDGFLYRSRPVLVIGGGDTAMEEALVLARTSSSVTVAVRADKLRASHALASRVLAHDKITLRYRTTVESFVGDGATLTHAMLRTDGKDGKDGRLTKLEVAAAFVAIGHQPNTAMLDGVVALRADGYIDVSMSGRSSRTSHPAIFAAGDVADPTYRQAITSAGSGAQAALDCERWLSEGAQMA